MGRVIVAVHAPGHDPTRFLALDVLAHRTSWADVPTAWAVLFFGWLAMGIRPPNVFGSPGADAEHEAKAEGQITLSAFGAARLI